jgi:hypothetical protein
VSKDAASEPPGAEPASTMNDPPGLAACQLRVTVDPSVAADRRDGASTGGQGTSTTVSFDALLSAPSAERARALTK